MTMKTTLRALSLLAALAVLPLAAHAATGTQMELTIKSDMHMPGVPPQAAAMMNRTRVVKQCIGNDRVDDPLKWVQPRQCTISDVHRTADGMTAHSVCKNDDMVLTGDIVVQRRPGGVVHSTIHTTSQGRDMQMQGTQVIDARPIGKCEVPATAQP